MSETTNTKRPGPIDISEEEFEAMAAARQREYEITTLLDQELGLAEPEIGNDQMVKAAAVLRDRGINPDDANQEQLLDALRRCSP
jgi:hypothetical protein